VCTTRHESAPESGRDMATKTICHGRLHESKTIGILVGRQVKRTGAVGCKGVERDGTLGTLLNEWGRTGGKGQRERSTRGKFQKQNQSRQRETKHPTKLAGFKDFG